jgi:hypothetical protein
MSGRLLTASLPRIRILPCDYLRRFLLSGKDKLVDGTACGRDGVQSEHRVIDRVRLHESWAESSCRFEVCGR